jgi:ribonuclease BN (tRNA processing enzyme)
VEVTFHGVRGAIPAPGPETVRYGGNTSCVAIKSSLDRLLILDAGTGIIALGKALLPAGFGKGQGNAAILLSHAHWDHIQGFPFFAPAFIPGNRFAVFGPARSSAVLEGMLEGQVNPHFSPLYTMKNLGATFDLLPMHGDPDDKPLWWERVAISARKNPSSALNDSKADRPKSAARAAVISASFSTAKRRRPASCPRRHSSGRVRPVRNTVRSCCTDLAMSSACIPRSGPGGRARAVAPAS